jgi:hypothetical protein
MMRDDIEIRLCTDCVFADANGAGTPEHDGGPSADWTGFLRCWDGWGFAAQTERFGDYHEIREPSFSWSPCDGCGSGLGGDRWDYIAYEIRKEAR